MEFLTGKAFVALGAFDLLGFGRNFARLHSVVRRWPVASKNANPETIERVCNSVNHALLWYPKHVRCLQRAAVTTCMLRELGVRAQMVLGAKNNPFKAHAWVEVNGRSVNERNDVQMKYGVWERC